MVVFTWKTLRIENHSSKQENNPKKQMVTLAIPEPLPGMKELAGALEEHWVTMIHAAIEKKSITGIPKFHKAMVMIEVTTPRGMNNPKGTFFRDGDFEHMAFSVVAKWGEIGSTIIRICELFQWKSHPIFNKNNEIL